MDVTLHNMETAFHPLADDETKYPMPDDGKANVANAGKEQHEEDTTEAPCPDYPRNMDAALKRQDSYKGGK
jgi:hypothetical protein